MTFVEPAKFSFLTFEHRVCHSFEGWMKTKIDAGAQNQNLDCVREKLPTLINARVDLSVILELEALRVLRLFTLRDVDLGDRGERDVAYLRRSPNLARRHSRPLAFPIAYRHQLQDQNLSIPVAIVENLKDATS